MPSYVLEDIGFINKAAAHKERLITISATGNVEIDGKMKRKLGVRFIRDPLRETPEDLELVPAVLPDEWQTTYTEKTDGFEVVLDDKGSNIPSRTIASKRIWMYQLSPYVPSTLAPPLNASKYPFQNALRRTMNEVRYNPVKAKYFDFREDHSPETTGDILNTFDLSSTLPIASEYGYAMHYFGDDVRKWIVLALEFTNSNAEQVMNKIFPDPHPGIATHYITMDFTRTRAHIEADVNEQLSKIHPNLRANIGPYEGPTDRRFNIQLPQGWSCTRREYQIGLYSESGETGLSSDGKTYIYQEEIETMNDGQGVVLENDQFTYLVPGAQSFPFPAPLYYQPWVNTNVELTWPTHASPGNWDENGLAIIKTVIGVDNYRYDQNRPWQLFTRLKIVPNEADSIAIKEAYWSIRHPGDELPTRYPAHFVRQVSGNVPAWNEPVMGEGPQIVSVFELDQNSIYSKQAKLRESSLEVDSNGAYMRITPPPIDGYGVCPYVNVKPVEAELTIVFWKPVVIEPISMFTGNSSEVQEAYNKLEHDPISMYPSVTNSVFEYELLTQPGPPGQTPVKILNVTDKMNYQWAKSSTIPFGVVLSAELVAEIEPYLNNPRYEVYVGYKTTTDFGRGTFDGPSLMTLKRLDGSILLPITVAWIGDFYLRPEAMLFNIDIEISDIDHDFNVVKALSYQAQLNYNLIREPSENSALALPFAISNVSGGKAPSDVKINLVVASDEVINLQGYQPSYSIALSELVADGNILGGELAGINAVMNYDDVADTLTIESVPSKFGLIAFNVKGDGSDYNPVFPPGTTTYRDTFTGWSVIGDDLNALPELQTNLTFAVPYTDTGSLIPASQTIAFETLLPTTAQRTRLASTGFYLSEVEASNNAMLISAEGDGTPFVTLQTDVIRPFTDKYLAALSNSVQRHELMKNDFFIMKSSDASLIALYKSMSTRTGGAPDAAIARAVIAQTKQFVISNETNNFPILFNQAELVTEEGTEYLYLSLPTAMSTMPGGTYEYYISIIWQNVGFYSFNPTHVKVNNTFVEPNDLQVMTQALETSTLDLTGVLSTAVKVIPMTYFADVGMLSSPFELQTVAATKDFSVYIDNHMSGDYDRVILNNSVLNCQGGLYRPRAALFTIFFKGATLPEGFSAAGTPYTVIQQTGGVLLTTKFAQLLLNAVDKTFDSLSAIYQDSPPFGVAVRVTMKVDSAGVDASYLGRKFRVYGNCRLVTGNVLSGSFLYTIGNTSTFTVGMSESNTLPPDVANLPIDVRMVACIPWTSAMVYKGHLGPVV